MSRTRSVVVVRGGFVITLMDLQSVHIFAMSARLLNESLVAFNGPGIISLPKREKQH